VAPKSSKELADMIATWLAVPGVHVVVRSDPVLVWRPSVVGTQAVANRYQQVADEVANDLRLAYELSL